MLQSSHAAIRTSEPPTPAQLKELFTQIETGKVSKASLQQFLRGGSQVVQLPELTTLSDLEVGQLANRFHSMYGACNRELHDRMVADRDVYDARFRRIPLAFPTQSLGVLEGLARNDHAIRCGFVVVLYKGDQVVRFIKEIAGSGYEWGEPDDGQSTRPHLWQTHDRARRYVLAVMNHRRTWLREPEAEVAFWCHPEAGWAHREKYLLMEQKWPGSPQQ